MKYIIKNCPVNKGCKFGTSWIDLSCNRCKDITDCVMKQIVEKLKPLQIITFEHDIKDMFNAEAKIKLKKVSEILEMLDIEECE